MGNRLAQALKIAVISCLGVAAFGVSGYADEQVTNSGDKSDAARSLEEILKQAVHSNFEEDLYETQENWKSQLSNSEVRLQWDPDHDPYGNKHTRKAIQLGLKGKILKNFAQDWIVGIEDITPFAHEQKKLLDAKMLDTFSVIEEKVVEIEDPIIKKNINLS